MNNDILRRIGLKIGHYTDADNLTGVTVFLAEQGADIGLDIRGSNTGSLNTPAFEPRSARSIVHGVVLAGGSTYGLESAFGVMRYLEEQGIGNPTRAGLVPGVTGAVIYDLAVGKNVKPGKAEGYAAAAGASHEELRQGNIGVGTGATAGKWFGGRRMRGGFGIGVTELPNGVLVAAFAVTNPLGDIVNPRENKFYSLTGKQEQVNALLDIPGNLSGLIEMAPENTTLAVIATNLAMKKIQLMKVAELAHDGMARAIHPTHTNQDGDIVFALSSHAGERNQPDLQEMSQVDLVGLAAADALTKAINSSIINAQGIEGYPAFGQS